MALSLRQTLRVPYLGPIIFSVFCILFLQQNIIPLKSTITDGLDGPNTIAFGNERRAVSWVYNNAAGNQFNVDEYVPPVIQYSYQYLFHWYDFSGRGTGHTETMTPLLYTIYEVDPPHPERLEAWLQRQKGIGKVLEEVHFGGITVQKRVRITK